MASNVRQFILINQRSQNVLAELTTHLQLRFIVEKLEKNAINASTCAANQRKARKNSLDVLAIAATHMNIHQIGSELAFNQISLEIFVENAHNFDECGDEDLGKLPENLLCDQLVGECSDRRVCVV